MADIISLAKEKSGLTIDIYCRDGSPLKITPPVIYGRGVGGAELSLMTWAETMAGRGHKIRIFNNPDTAGVYDGVEYLPQAAFDPGQYRDVFIVYRSPSHCPIDQVKAGVKLHWSTDQYTVGNYAKDIVPFVDKIVCISPYHMADYEGRYNPAHGQITYIDLGVRLQDYSRKVEKIKNRFIFCSVPERGLEIVRLIWPQIREAIPDASLVITADHRLWGSHSPNNQQYRLNMLPLEGIIFLGAISRGDLVKRQMEAQIHLFPCIYPELFCISSAECQVAGAYSVTSDNGALSTTNGFGQIVPGNPHDPTWQKRFVETAVGLALDQKRLTKLAEAGMSKAIKRFDWHGICDEWEKVIEAAGKDDRIEAD